MSKKSLDILEEQLFGLLEDYVPQTGRGYSDGNGYVGKNTKGPYEDRMAEADSDKPWYKKVYKKDSKNVKILIGHGTKTPKHAKKGGPYTKDPPARRPVNKLSAPPMALQEKALPQQFKDAFLKIQNAQVQFKTLKELKDSILGVPFTVFKKDGIYTGVVSGNNITLTTEKGKHELTKEEFIKKLEAADGELCQNVDCNSSKITTDGKTLTFNQFMQTTDQLAPQPDQKQDQTTIQAKQQAEAQQNAQRAVGIGQNIENGANIQTAIKKELGYNPKTKEFANAFYDTIKPAILQIKDPDQKKMAALTAVLFAEVSMIPTDVATNIYDSIDLSFVGDITQIARTFIEKNFPELSKLKDLYKDVTKKAEDLSKKFDKISDTLGKLANPFDTSSLSNLPQAEQGVNQVVVIGNKQKDVLYDAFKTYLGGKGYGDLVKTFSLADDAEFSKITEPSILNQIAAAKNKIGIIFISFGTSNAIDALNFNNVVTSLKKAAPKSKIIWIGLPPLQSGADSQMLRNGGITTVNQGMKAASLLNDVLFIDPGEYLTSSEAPGVYTDNTTLGPLGAKKVFDGALTGKKSEEKSDSKQVSDADLLAPISFFTASSLIDYSILEKGLQIELIKLSKRAKQIFGDKAKIYIKSAHREDSKRHKANKAVDIRIDVNGKNKTAQETYAFIISSILDGAIKDGGVGYYANNTGVYNAESMKVDNEYPHYDVYDKNKWFWFKCGSQQGQPDPCSEIKKNPHFKQCVTEGDGTQDCSKSQTTMPNTPASRIADSSNPLGLPKDVFSLIGSFKPNVTNVEEKNKIYETTATQLRDLPSASGKKKKFFLMGNSQTSHFSIAIGSFLNSKGYSYDKPYGDIYKFAVSNSGPEELLNNQELKQYLDNNKEDIGGVLISYGGRGHDEAWWQNSSKNLVKFLRESVPNIQIIWIGGPAIQKKRNDYQQSNALRTKHNAAIEKSAQSESFVFINPLNYMTDRSWPGGDGLHIPLRQAKNVIDAAIDGKKPFIVAQKENVQLIKQRFTEAGIPDNLTKAAIVNSWFESGWNTNKIGDIVTKVSGECARQVESEEGRTAWCGGGLFGIHSCGGMGGCRSTASGMKDKSMSLADIKDPEKSIAKMILYIKKHDILQKAKQDGVTTEELVEYFCRNVEKPSAPDTKCPNRKSETTNILDNAGIE